MPTLANIDGRSLALDLNRTFGNLDKFGDVRREEADKKKRTELATTAAGIPPEAIQEKAGGFLRKIAPSFADALAKVKEGGDLAQVDQMRTEAERGRETADRILAAPTQAAKQAIILEQAEAMRQKGGDTRELLKASGLSSAEMDLRAQKSKLTSDAALKVLPAPTAAQRARARAELSVRDPNALVALQRDEAAALKAEQLRIANARRAAAARTAARAPKTALGKRLADIRTDVANGNIEAAVGDQLMTDARAAAKQVGVDAAEEANKPRTELGQTIQSVALDVANGTISQEDGDRIIVAQKAEMTDAEVAAREAEAEKDRIAGIADLGTLSEIHKRGKTAYEKRRAQEPDLPPFEEFEEFSRAEIQRLSTPDEQLAQLRVDHPDKAPGINIAGAAAVALKTGDKVAWDEQVAAAGLPELDMTLPNYQILAGKVLGDKEAVLAGLGGGGEEATGEKANEIKLLMEAFPEMTRAEATERVLGDGEGSADTIATLTRKQKIQSIMRNQNVSEQVASGITDGVLKVSRDPTTQEMLITNLATGTSRVATSGEVAASEEAAALETPTGEETTVDPVTTPADTPFSAAERSFGLGGKAREFINKFQDTLGFEPSFDEVQTTVAEFEVFKENITAIVAEGYSGVGRPPAFLIKAIQNMSPTPASLFQGPAEAKKKLEALKGSLQRSEDLVVRSLGERQSPADAAKKRSNLAALKKARDEINLALKGFGDDAPTSFTSEQEDLLREFE